MTNTTHPTTQARRRYRVEAIISILALVAMATTVSLTEHGFSASIVSIFVRRHYK